MPIPRTAVTSSQVVSIGHEPSTLQMDVEFRPFKKTGDAPNLVYRYQNVTVELHFAIVTAPSIGAATIAVGVAAEIKRRGGSEKVFLMIGDMTAQTGNAHECIKYARLNGLPLVVVVEDNGKSVCSDTKETWGGRGAWGWEPDYYYQWDLAQHFPHSGAGRRIQF